MGVRLQTGTKEPFYQKYRTKIDAENDLRKRGIVNWRQVAQDGDVWRRGTGEQLVLLGYWSHIIIIIIIIIINDPIYSVSHPATNSTATGS